MTLRERLLGSGIISERRPKDHAAMFGVAVLRLDTRGHHMAAVHIEQGKHGAEVMAIPAGFALWHQAALLARERRQQRQRSNAA